MRLYTIQMDGEELAAVMGQDGRLYPIRQFFTECKTMNDFIDHISHTDRMEFSRKAADGNIFQKKDSYGMQDVTICAPIVRPHQDVICVGVNYDEHINETKDAIDFSRKQATVYFSKRVNEAIGNDGIVAHYDFVDSLDYEVELCVVIGEDTKNVSEEEALSYVAGYSIMNDFSARNLQMKHVQWYLGKSLDTYTAIGPCIVTADEFDDIQDLHIECTVNGKLRQSSNTKYMIQSVAKIIAELSQGITLKKGTLIATGTPGGVAMGMETPIFLKSGDNVTCKIEGIGELTNICE